MMGPADDSRSGDWLQTFTGRPFWPMDPRPDDIHIEDIAHALSNLCRFGGHCRTFYSVAQHSVLVSKALPPEYKRWGLLHDASEAYICDVPRPLKYHLLNYLSIETKVMMAVAIRFGLPALIPAAVKEVDDAMLVTEVEQLMETSQRPWEKKWTSPLGIIIDPWSAEFSKQMFLEQFETLFKDAAL